MSAWDKIKNILTLSEEEDDYDEPAAQDEVAEEPKKRAYEDAPKKNESPRLVKSKSANMPSSQMQVILVKPDRFEDVTSIVDHLNERKTIVLNLEAASPETARRMIDFVSGAAYARHGIVRKVANGTFIVVPQGVDMMGELVLDDFSDSKLYF